MTNSGPRGLFAGLATLDTVYAAETYPGRNEKITATDVSVAAGGPAANAAVTFAALGGHATLVTALGSSGVAALVYDELASLGVEVIDLDPSRSEPPPMSTAVVTEGTGERAVVGSDAVHSAIDAGGLEDTIVRNDVVLVDGHYPALAVGAVASARCPVVVDAGRWKPVMADLVVNNPEMLCSNDFQFNGASGGVETAARLRDVGVETVVVTNGAGDIHWWDAGSHGRVRPPTTDVIDTLGAGDVFHGAYAYFRCLPHLDIAERIRRASDIAALRCSLWGIRSFISRLPERTT